MIDRSKTFLLVPSPAEKHKKICTICFLPALQRLGHGLDRSFFFFLHIPLKITSFKAGYCKPIVLLDDIKF